jgi:hypothetical protein
MTKRVAERARRMGRWMMMRNGPIWLRPTAVTEVLRTGPYKIGQGSCQTAHGRFSQAARCPFSYARLQSCPEYGPIVDEAFAARPLSNQLVFMKHLLCCRLSRNTLSIIAIV